LKPIKIKLVVERSQIAHTLIIPPGFGAEGYAAVRVVTAFIAQMPVYATQLLLSLLATLIKYPHLPP
jgi:hypothetical protein